MISISQAAASQFKYAHLGEAMSGFHGLLLIVIGVVLFAAMVRLTLGWSAVKAASLIIPVSACAALILARADYSNALLFDALPTDPARVTMAIETGGGCTPIRTQVGFDDGTQLTLKGSFPIDPGTATVRKVTRLGNYICVADPGTQECRELN